MKFLDLAGVAWLWNAMKREQTAALTRLTASGGWLYWMTGGCFEAFYTGTAALTIDEADGALYRSALQTLTLPAGITGAGTVAIKHAAVSVAGDAPAFAAPAALAPTGVAWRAVSGAVRNNAEYAVTAHVAGLVTTTG